METILYHAMAGGLANFKRQEVYANNLANVNTPGFKADLFQAQTQYMNDTKGNNINNGQSFIVQTPNEADLTPGELITTGRDLDIAVDGEGWIAVKDTNGKESYTRSGSFHLDPNGQLVTGNGLVVMGDGGPISIPPAKSVDIGIDGTISVVPQDGEYKSLAILDRIKLVKLNKNNVVKNENGLFQLKNGGAAVADGSVKVMKGAIEGSNVGAVEQMVGMISAGREFDAHMRILSTVDDNAQKLAQILQQ